MFRVIAASLALIAVLLFADVRRPVTTDAGAPTNLTLALDCNVAMAGVQPLCHVATDTLPMRDVGIVLTNNGSTPLLPSQFVANVLNPEVSRLSAPVINMAGTLNDNPDFNQAAFAANWDCGPIQPNPDTDGNAATQTHFIYCFDGAPVAPVLAPGASVLLATVRYNVVGPAGTVTLGFDGAGGSDLSDDSFNEAGSCYPVLIVPMNCVGTHVHLYCAIDQADINGDGIVSVSDHAHVAAHQGQFPGPAHVDQNFDTAITAADQVFIAQSYYKNVSQCP